MEVEMTERMYLVFCGHKVEEYAPERNLSDFSRENTIKDLVDAQYENVSRILEVGTGADVTHELMQEVADRWSQQGEPLARWQFQALEMHLGTRAARNYMRAV